MKRDRKHRWKKIPIKGLEDYIISDHGSVVSLKYGKCKLRKLTKLKRTRHHVLNIWQGKKHKTYLVSRLVLSTFRGPCPKRMEASHLNGNSEDDKLCNLKWESHAENMKRTIEHKTSNRGEKNPFNKWRTGLIKIVKRRLLNGEKPKTLNHDYGIPMGTLYAIKCGSYWKWL